MIQVERMADYAHRFGTDSDEFKLAYSAWVEELADKPTHRPPVELIVHRNCIPFYLQSAIGSEYRYVPLEKFVEAEFCMEIESPRERILREITTGRRAKQEIQLIEAGIIKPEEGVNFRDLQYGTEPILDEEDDDLVS